MSLLLNCFIHGETLGLFVGKIEKTETIYTLKTMIKEKKAPLFNHLDVTDFDLWMVNKPVSAKPAKTLADRIGDLGELGQFATKLQEPTDSLLDIFSTQPSHDCIHIIVKKSLAGQQFHAPVEVRWLAELHSKIWGRKDLESKIFRTVEVTRATYDTLQNRLNGKYSERIKGYKKKGRFVLSDKLDVLNNAVTVNDDEMEPGNSSESESDCEINSYLPFTLRYLDFTSLNMSNRSNRFPLPLLYRQEYDDILKIINNANPSAGSGSVIISGQPGTGKTAFLYLMIIESLIAGSPFLYQTTDGDVYLVNEIGVEAIGSRWAPKTHMMGFVDADKGRSEPNVVMRLSGSVQIIVATSPKGASQKWLKQTGQLVDFTAFVTSLWSPQELFLTGIFLHPRDITFDLLLESTGYFGHNPRQCFVASISMAALKLHVNNVSSSIKSRATGDIMQLIGKCQGDEAEVPNMIFEIFPSDTDPDSDLNRLLSCCYYKTVSQWAFDTLMTENERREGHKAYDFYKLISPSREYAEPRGRAFERRVLYYLGCQKNDVSFEIRGLSPTSSNQVTWTYPGRTPCYHFREPAVIDDINKAVQDKRPVHLVPFITNYPAVDSVLYDPKDENGFITCIQVTVTLKHPIKVSGLQRIQKWFKPGTLLNDLRPTSTKPWRFLFVVPLNMAATYELQKLEGDTDNCAWAGKVEQYVLGLEEETIFKPYDSIVQSSSQREGEQMMDIDDTPTLQVEEGSSNKRQGKRRRI